MASLQPSVQLECDRKALGSQISSSGRLNISILTSSNSQYLLQPFFYSCMLWSVLSSLLFVVLDITYGFKHELHLKGSPSKKVADRKYNRKKSNIFMLAGLLFCQLYLVDHFQKRLSTHLPYSARTSQNFSWQQGHQLLDSYHSLPSQKQLKLKIICCSTTLIMAYFNII